MIEEVGERARPPRWGHHVAGARATAELREARSTGKTVHGFAPSTPAQLLRSRTVLDSKICRRSETGAGRVLRSG